MSAEDLKRLAPLMAQSLSAAMALIERAEVSWPNNKYLAQAVENIDTVHTILIKETP